MWKGHLITLGALSFALLACGGVDDATSLQKVEGDAEPVDTSSSALTLSESFETGWGGFIADHHLQCEPGCGPLEWSLVRSTARAQHGIYSLAGTIDGHHDDGTIWIERPLAAPTGRSSVQVKVEFYLWSPTQGIVNPWPVVGYAGTANPEVEGDFTVIGQTDQLAGWKKYSLTKTVTLNGAASVWVGLGFGCTWEVTRSYFIDSVVVTVL